MSHTNPPEPYEIAPKPGIYNGIPMKSKLEMRTAQALDRIGVRWEYEPDHYGNQYGLYTPDFLIPEVRVSGWPFHDLTRVYLEARPKMFDPAFKQKADMNAATLEASTEDPLLFVGMREMPAALLGWCYGIRKGEPVPGVLGEWRRVTLEGRMYAPEPCLYVDADALIWVDGFYAGQGTR